jgi:hypothetical protein
MSEVTGDAGADGGDAPSADDIEAAVGRALERFFDSREFIHHMNRAFYAGARNSRIVAQANATMHTARFLDDHKMHHLRIPHEKLRRQATVRAPKDGLFMEFGVYDGRWLNFVASQRPDAHFFGFDSFEGLPTDWSTEPRGTFDLQGVLPEVEPNVTLVPGWFDESLPAFLAEHPEPVSFIHMDCDLYASTMTVLELLRRRLRVGARIVFDDYFLEPGQAYNIRFEYTGFQAESASVVLTSIPSFGSA